MTSTFTLAPSVPLSLERLLETKLLLQAGSGFGKSWAIRRLAEQTAPLVQQLIIDPEGEFATLRERFDYVICAPHDADAIASPRTAALLARRLLETGVSAILDIYDLKPGDRQEFVARFLTELVNAPKRLWHPVLIVLDEAQLFAPEKDTAESAAAVANMASLGRKRGQCLVCATQRLSKLDKDVAAELHNKMIGRAGLDLDIKRAADELGMTKQEATEAFRSFDPGEFFIYGPALTPTVEKIRVGAVQTTHPKAGTRLMQAPPAPSAKIKGVISAELADLPQQAETEIRTLEDAKRALADTQRQLRAALKAQPAAAAPATSTAELQRIQRQHAATVKALEKALQVANENHVRLYEYAGALEERIADCANVLEGKAALLTEAAKGCRVWRPTIPKRPRLEAIRIPTSPAPAIAADVAPLEQRPKVEAPAAASDVSGPLGKAQRLLDALAWWEAVGFERAGNPGVAAMAGQSHTSSSYERRRSELVKAGLVVLRDGQLELTDAGRARAQLQTSTTSAEVVQAAVLQILEEPLRRMLYALLAAYPDSMSNQDVAAAANQSHTSSSYERRRSRLVKLELVTLRDGQLRAQPFLFLEK